MDKRLTFFSSRWSELPFEDLLEIDDQNAFEWQKEDSLKRLLLQLSGWHFEYWLANKTSFPFLSNNIDSLRIAALEDLREASEFEIPRYLVRKNSLEYFKADLVRLMRIPILHRSPLFHSKNATKLSAEEINEQQDREAALSKPLLEQFFVTLAKCDARTRSIVRLRLGVGLDKPMTLEEIGSEIGVTRERIRQVDGLSTGFIYMVSNSSITGAKSGISEGQLAYFERINQMKLVNPRLIGFGISDNETFETACQYAHGAIIGSAFIKALAKAENIKETVTEFVGGIRNVKVS